MSMEDKTAERIFTVIDGVKVSISNVEKLFIAQNEIIKALTDKTGEFIKKVDDNVFHPEAGCLFRHKSMLKIQQAKLSWYGTILILILGGMLGTSIGLLWKK